MTREWILGGVLVSPIVPACALSMVSTILLSMLLVRLRLYRWVWSRPLAEVAIFCILLGLLTIFSPFGGTA